jgi:hypothetical protein
VKLHRFNDAGVAQFSQYLDALAADPKLPQPAGLLTDAGCTEVVPPGIDIEQRGFANRMEAASHLFKSLSRTDIKEPEYDVGLWSWLSLFYFDQVCPVDKNGKRKPFERARHVPAVDNFRKRYRHLLAAPYRIYKAHRDDPSRALILLCGPLHKPGQAVESLSNRQDIVQNPYALNAATKLYYDPSTGSFKRGAGTKGPGSPERFTSVLDQFDRTWDLFGTESEAIIRHT